MNDLQLLPTVKGNPSTRSKEEDYRYALFAAIANSLHIRLKEILGEIPSLEEQSERLIHIENNGERMTFWSLGRRDAAEDCARHALCVRVQGQNLIFDTEPLMKFVPNGFYGGQWRDAQVMEIRRQLPT